MKRRVVVVELFAALLLGGCSGGQGIEGAGRHLMTCMGAESLPRLVQAEFKMAVDAGDVAEAKSVLAKYRATVAEQKEKLAALPADPWQSTNDCVAAMERLLEAEETIVADEMAKIVERMNNGAPSDAQSQQIAASFAKIDALVAEKVGESHAAWERLRLELAAEAAQKPN